jgi:ribosomal protein S18 acetylase RimI-like enzyme
VAALRVDARVERSRRRYCAGAQGGQRNGAAGGRNEGVLVASVLVGHDGHRGWVYYVTVDPDHRHQGYGREIMAAAENWLRARGIEKLQLMVRGDNAKVHAFYRSIGYYDQERVVFAKWLDGREPTP